VKKIKLALLTAALAGSSLAMAQDKAAFVQQFVDMQRPSLESMARGLVEQPVAGIAVSGRQYLQTQVPLYKREAAGKAADAEHKKYFDDAYPIVRDKALQLGAAEIGPMMDQNFSEEELKQMFAWFNSPVNKKLAEVNQRLMPGLLEKLAAETRPAIEPKLIALERNVATALGAPVNPPGAAAPARSPVTAPARAPAKK
jgi:hypothetical protein